MKKNVFVLVLFSSMTLMVQAQVAKYCMTYSDYLADKWTPVESLTGGRTIQACQMKVINNQVRFRTGDKIADKIIKKQVFAVKYGDELFVNCRNLRNNEICLDVTGYSHAVRYDNDKLCVMAYKYNDAALLLGLGLDIASIFVDNKPLKLGMTIGSSALWLSSDYLNSVACYLIDSEANAKGKTAVTRMNDQFMENLLASDAPLLMKYKAISNKRNRQSASNVLPILMEKGLVTSMAIN